MLRTRALFMVCVSMLGYAPVLAQDSADINAKIRKEETDNSQILRTMHFLTDVYGPRLTGSPNLKAAGEWAIKQMASWGFENGHLEPWDFGHPGWTNERFSGFINSPVKDTLTCEVLAWTPGTNGPVTAKAYQMILPEKPTQEEFTAYLATQKDKVKSMIVFAGKTQIVPVTINPSPRRQEDQQAKQRYDPDNPNQGFGRGGQRGIPGPAGTLWRAGPRTRADFLRRTGSGTSLRHHSISSRCITLGKKSGKPTMQ